MDDYLSKPVDAQNLNSTLARWFFGDILKEDLPKSNEPLPVESARGNQGSPVNLVQLLFLTDGDLAQEKIFTDLLFQANETVLEILRKHVLGENTDEAWKAAAHKLEGLSAQIGASKLDIQAPAKDVAAR